MPVIGMQITKIDAVRKNNPTPGFKVESVPAIVSVEEKELPTLGNNGKVLTINFNFNVEYKPDIAMIKIAGEILFLEEGERVGAKTWAKNKSLPQEMMIEVYNMIFRKGLLKALVLSDDMQLPPPLQVPIVAPKKGSEKSKDGKGGESDIEGQSSYIG
ncbi:MAG: hypothetical protein HY051_04090 [Candidatus Aenigmarchaeota archaeon]|nr:hypothetical protein [Candidatus Aenigmarchaeota archaeon]